MTKKDLLRGNDDIEGCNMNECDGNEMASNNFDADYTLILPQYSNKNSFQVSGKCSICLEDYEEGDTVIWSTNQSCLHVYHKNCILTWLCKAKEGLCPICKQNFCENDYEIDAIIQEHTTNENILVFQPPQISRIDLTPTSLQETTT